MIPGLTQKRPVDLIRAREEISWVADDDLEDVEPRSAAAAAALSFFTWGGGHIMAFDRWRGTGLIAALIATLILFANVTFLPGVLLTLILLAGGAAFAYDAYRRARAITRFARTRAQLRIAGVADPAHYRLLASAAAVDPNIAGSVPALAPMVAQGGLRIDGPGLTAPRHADLLDQLRKLYALRAAGIITDLELSERKIDMLAAIAPDDRAALDQLLFELLPLADEGVLEPADFEFLKGASAGR